MSGSDKASFTCTWDIEDIKFWILKQIKGLRTPTFRTEATGTTEWALQFIPVTTAKDELVELVLRRVVVDSTSSQLVCKLSVLAADGEVIREHKIEGDVSKENDFCSGVSVKPSDVIEYENDPMSKGKLTLQCKMWKQGVRPSLSFIHTVFHQKTFSWKIEQFQTTPIPVKSFQVESLEFIMVLYKSESYSRDGNLDVKIIQTKGESSARCSIRVIGDDGKSKTLPYDHHLNNISDNTTYWNFQIPLKDEYLVDGALSLKCEFTVGVSEVSNFEQRVHSTTTEHKSQTNNIYPDSSKETIAASSTLQEDIFNLYRDGRFCDAILLCDGTSFPVHKTVLCAKSRIFCELFEKNLEEHRNGIHIEDLDRLTMDRMLLHMYKGTLDNITSKEAFTLYSVAKKFAILPLQDQCMSILKTKLSVFNVCDALVLADTHQEDDLMQSVEDFIGNHYNEVFPSSEWKEIENSKPDLTTKVLREIYVKEKQA